MSNVEASNIKNVGILGADLSLRRPGYACLRGVVCDNQIIPSSLTLCHDNNDKASHGEALHNSYTTMLR